MLSTFDDVAHRERTRREVKRAERFGRSKRVVDLLLSGAGLLFMAPALLVIAIALLLVDGRPIAIGTHWFSAARFPGIATLLAEEASITRVLARLGIADYRREATRIIARMPTPEEATLLEQSRTRPVLVTEALNVDPEGQPVEVSFGCYASGRVQIVAES